MTDLPAIRAALEPVVEAQGMELYDIEYLHEYGRWVLRLYIDKENGITLDDCELINNAVEPVLDALDPIQNPYVLEVSSPGIERKLVKDRHYLNNLGEYVEVKLKKPIKERGKQKKFRGTLINLEDDFLIISEGTNNDEAGLRLPRGQIAYCRLIWTED